MVFKITNAPHVLLELISQAKIASAALLPALHVQVQAFVTLVNQVMLSRAICAALALLELI